MDGQVNVVHAAIVLAALVLALPAQAASPVWDALAAAPPRLVLGEARRAAGRSFLEQANPSYAEEPFHFVPASFPGPLPAPRRPPETAAMLLASLGLIVYLGSRRHKALAASH
jgi:hypothetical protein